VRGALPAASSSAVVSGGQTALAVAPIPLATAAHGQQLIIRYFRHVGSIELTADADVPIMPGAYHYALVVGANAYMHEAIGNVQKAAQFRALFKERIAVAMSEDMGMRLRDQQLMQFVQGADIYPITGQSPATFDPQTRPYDKHT
jgi:hypothetical protein